MKLSVVIPLFNEENSIVELNKSIVKVVSSMDIEFEIIYVDDGSTDNSWNIIKDLGLKLQNLKGIRFLKKFWKITSSFCRI